MEHNEFFKAKGALTLSDVCVEDLYQAIKARLYDEVSREVAEKIYKLITGENHDNI